jgi:beta-N-acetylhexosaminidase
LKGDVELQTPESLLESLTLEEKVGQLLTIGFPSPSLSQDDIEVLNTISPGGVIYFSRNIESPSQVRNLSETLQKLSPVPLLICTDQEGGTVMRIVNGVTVFPGNMALGATRSTAMAYQAGKITGEELYMLGINMNLAPCLDVNNNPKNPVIGLRSFGEDPELVADLGSAFALGLQDASVIATGKHFPGHGDTEIDSHHLLPVINHDRNRLEAVEFAPFKKAIAQGIGAIMTAHIAFPALEGNTEVPATLSRKVLTDLLRNELGFDGLIVTDCMEMKAIKDTFGTAEGAILAVQAGADIILVSHTRSVQLEVYNALLAAVKEKRISEDDLDQKVLRILKAKFDARIMSQNWTESKLTAPSPENLRVAGDMAQSAVVVLKGAELLPLPSRAVVVDFETSARSIAEDVIKGHVYLGDLAPEGSVGVRIPLGGQDIREVLALLKDQKYDALVVGTLDADRNPYQAELVAQLKTLGKPMVAVGLRAPYEFSMLKDLVDSYIVTFSHRKPSLEAAWNVLLGKSKAPGILPVSLPE